MEIKKEDWDKKAEELFGEKRHDWRFSCPACGMVMSVNKAKELYPDVDFDRWNPVSECIGRYTDKVDCNWCAYGLFSGPVFVQMEDGRSIAAFDFDGVPLTNRTVKIIHTERCDGCHGSFICEICNKRIGTCYESHEPRDARLCVSCSMEADNMKAFGFSICGIEDHYPFEKTIAAKTASKARMIIARDLVDTWSCTMNEALRYISIRRKKIKDDEARRRGIPGYFL